jgi:phenylacetate-CoA ligase
VGSFLRLADSASAVWHGHAWNEQRTAEFQATRVLELARHALRHVSIYRKLWGAARVTPGDLRSMDNFHILPILSKEELQDAGSDSIAEGIDRRKLRCHETGGSSGQPLDIHRTAFEDRLLQAIRIRRIMKMHGVRLSARRVEIRYGGDAMWSQGTLDRLGILRKQYIDCRLEINQIKTEIVRANPNILTGYPCSLADVADKLELALPKLRIVITGGDSLTQPLRQRIEAGFGKPVYSAYGAHECNLLALQCKRGVFHLAEESALIEVLRPDGRPASIGEQGEAVVTSLHSFAMPIIRYRLGDLLVLGNRCHCGASGRTLQQLVGRVQELFERPDGSTYHPFNISGPLDTIGADKTRTYRVTQLSPQCVEVLIEPRGEFSDKRIEMIRQGMLEAFDYPVELEVQLTQGLLAEKNGKFEAFRRGPNFKSSS